MAKIREDVKKGIKKGEVSKSAYWSHDHSDFAKYVLSDLVQNMSIPKYSIPNDFDWDKIELFIKVFERFLKEIIMTKKVVKANDWYDVFNLIYVRKGDKYWTNEKYWLRLIDDSGMSRYLVNQP